MSSFIQEKKELSGKRNSKRRKNKNIIDSTTENDNKNNKIINEEFIKDETKQKHNDITLLSTSNDKKFQSKPFHNNYKSNEKKLITDTTIVKKGLLKISKDLFKNISSSSNINNKNENVSSNNGNVTNDITWLKLQEKKNNVQEKSSLSNLLLNSSIASSSKLTSSTTSIEELSSINISKDEEKEMMTFDSNLLKITHLERNFNNSIKQIIKDDYYLLGPAIGAPEMYNYFVQLEKLLMDNLNFNSLSKTFISSINNKFVSKLWQIYLSQLNLFISAFNKSHLNSSIVEYKDRILINFINLIKLYQEKIYNLIEKLLSSIENKMLDHSFNITFNESITTLYLAVGNLYKMKESYCKGNNNNNNDDIINDKGKDLLNFHEANNYSPWVGTPYKSISSIYKSNGKIFESIYYLIRSMSVVSCYDGHEPLLSLFEYIKKKTEELDICNSFSAIKYNKHRQRFHYNFLTCLGLAYSRAGIDLFDSYLRICKKHLAMMLQMMKIDCDKSNINSISNSSNNMEYKKDINSSIIDLSMIQSSPLIDHIVDDSYKSILMILSLLNIVMKKHNIKEKLDNITLSNITNSLHSIQCIPGFLDLSQLLIEIVFILLCGNEVNTVAIDGNHFKSVCKCVNVFTMWLKINQEFYIISIIEKELWMKLEDSLVIYYNSLPNSNDHINNIVEEDKNLLNFLPLENNNDIDIYNNNKIIQQYLLIDNHLDVNSFKIRITRYKDIIKYLSNKDLIIGIIKFNNNRVANSNSIKNNDNLKIINIANKIELKIVKSISKSKNDNDALLFQTSAIKDTNQIESVNNNNYYNYNIEINKEVVENEIVTDFKLEVGDNNNISSNLQFQSRCEQLIKRQQQKHQIYYNFKPNKPNNSNHLIVLDASNIAMRHGLNLKFSCLGIQIVLDFFRVQGY